MFKFSNHIFQVLFAAVLFSAVLCGLVSAQVPVGEKLVGEKLTYEISLSGGNVGFAEISSISSGTYLDRPAVELRGKLKISSPLGARLIDIERTRTVIATPESLIPIAAFTKDLANSDSESKTDFIASGGDKFDVVTLIYALRQNPTGSFQITEGGKSYLVNATVGGSETVTTLAGEFSGVRYGLQSEFFNEVGISDVSVLLDGGNDHVPAAFSFKVGKFQAKGELSGWVKPKIPEIPQPTPTPIIAQPTKTPRPIATPKPYVPNVKLSDDMPFAIGERLEYTITRGGKPFGAIRFLVKERIQTLGRDSLILSALITGRDQGNPIFEIGNELTTSVDPQMLYPMQMQGKFSIPLSMFNRTAVFDQNSGKMQNGNESIDIPTGTHNVLSLFYAMRAFNLRFSRNTANPINDTRVAVFWNTRPYVFTLRPADSEVITIGKRKISVQRVSLTTGVPELDIMAPKVWFTNDESRIPMKITLGDYLFELNQTQTVIPPK